MTYINLDTMEYPRFQGDIDLDPDAQWAEVIETDVPVVGPNQVLIQLAPENVGGVWSKVWSVKDLTDLDKKNKAIEQARLKVLNNRPITQEDAELLINL